ncbi:hypothetical protein, partial [Escherichia coli]|uniref:hypothetical protein n=1 Tax=Escherichia coli TaxID=562 RepID=UPI001AD8E5FB
MDWERRILHSSALCFPKKEDAYSDYNRPLLPYALIKHENIKTRERLTVNCPPEELGGYQPISMAQWQSKAV